MTANQWDAIERQARIYVSPELTGPAADGAVRTIMAWEWSNETASPDRRSAAWSRIKRLASFADIAH